MADEQNRFALGLGIYCRSGADFGFIIQPRKGFIQKKDITLYRDGVRYVAKAGETLEITTGNSVTLPPYVYHRFYTKTGTGDLIVGEVSKINDDNIDNVFASPRDRFSSIEEDEAPYRLLVCEYK